MNAKTVAIGFGAVLILLSASGVPARAREWTLDERVASQRAIERVYWSHRVWPKENQVAKPALEAVLPDDSIRARVEDTLAKSNALEKLWGRPITSGQLQAEMERMARGTKSPGMLRELFAALDNDPERIAETLARSALAERLLRSWYAADDRFDAWWAVERARHLGPIPATTGAYRGVRVDGTGCEDDTWRPLPFEHPDLRSDFSTVWTGSELIVWGGFGVEYLLNTGAIYDPATDTWTPTSLGPGVASARRFHSAVWTGTEMIVWGGAEYDMTHQLLNTGARYNPATGSWTPVSTTAAPSARLSATALWTGTEMIVWGGADGTGALASGARYRPSSNSWLGVSSAGAPLARSGYVAVWTGAEMILWGGFRAGNSVSDGSRYNPITDSWTATSGGPPGLSNLYGVWSGSEIIVWGAGAGSRYRPSTNTWTPMATAGSPTYRELASAVWTGTEMILWGGRGSAGEYDSGGRYNPSTNTWTALPASAGSPSARYSHAAVWTGTEMLVWGGTRLRPLSSGGRFSPSTNSWVPTAVGNGPEPRFDHSTVWTGTEMIVWGGGLNGYPYSFNDGGRYDPATDTWARMTLAGAPLQGGGCRAVWTGTEMIVWRSNSNASPSVYRYAPQLDAWTPASTVNAPADRYGATAVWTGGEMIVWGGGVSGGPLLNTGGRYHPATDTWATMSTGANVPSARAGHAAVWTGKEMLVWGGEDTTPLGNGGRYDPATDAWSPMATAGAPSPRIGNTATWTGHELIVWGGHNGSTYYAAGDRYFPDTNTWGHVSDGHYLLTRADHTATWTGREMIVWGGYGGGNEGSRYDPAADSWTYIITGDHVPPDRSLHTSVWTGQEMIVWGGTPLTVVTSAYCAAPVCVAVPGEATGLRLARLPASGALLSWSPAPGAVEHDVVRGLLAELPVGTGGGSASETCLRADAATSVSDAEAPASGAGFWYVVRGDNACGNGDYGAEGVRGQTSAPRISSACP